MKDKYFEKYLFRIVVSLGSLFGTISFVTLFPIGSSFSVVNFILVAFPFYFTIKFTLQYAGFFRPKEDLF